MKNDTLNATAGIGRYIKHSQQTNFFHNLSFEKSNSNIKNDECIYFCIMKFTFIF